MAEENDNTELVYQIFNLRNALLTAYVDAAKYLITFDQAREQNFNLHFRQAETALNGLDKMAWRLVLRNKQRR
jgi:hypothetical protein